MNQNQESNITQLNNSHTRAYHQSKQVASQRKAYLKKRMMFIVGIGMLLLVTLAVPIMNNYMKAHNLREERELASDELDLVKAHQEDLQYYIDQLNDEQYVAKLARNEYYVTGEGEIVFNLPDEHIPDYQRVIQQHKEARHLLRHPEDATEPQSE
ncbi:septum formation initiator family protein [Dolosigranulum savutiense]|uniref:Septum formation initiator family protein n=1 Tax=Dolosigranulum savutiense TaxID=3110288 RepID=A0AB74TT64_9LACT